MQYDVAVSSPSAPEHNSHSDSLSDSFAPVVTVDLWTCSNFEMKILFGKLSTPPDGRMNIFLQRGHASSACCLASQ